MFIAAATGRFCRLMVLMVLLLAGCGANPEKVRVERSKYLDRSDVVSVAVVWDRAVKDFMLVEGVTQAADEINGRGGLFGRPIRVKVFYARNDRHEQKLAKEIARDTSIAAVIGHRLSANAIPASISYEQYGMLFLAPSSSNTNLTNHGFEFTFRTLPSDYHVSQEIAAFMGAQGHRNVAVVDDRTVYGKGIADGVMEALGDVGLKVAVRRHYTSTQKNFKRLCAELSRHEFDALFLGGTLPQAAEFIREARQMGVKQRVYGGAALDSRELEQIAGSAANGTVVPSSFNPDHDRAATQQFVADFRKRFGKTPDTRAALGYDSMNLLFEAMRRSKSADPLVVATNMRFIQGWQGVTGRYTFNLQGDLVDKKSYFKYLNQTRFVYFEMPAEKELEPDP